MPPRRVRVAVAGCGEVAQIMHIPYLVELNRHFELVAVADVSPSVAAGVAARYGVPNWYTDHFELLEREKPEALLVLTSNEYHGPISIDGMRKGAHILVEKPMCISPQEGREMVRVREETGRTLMVAYMKRYDPNYLLGRTMLQTYRETMGPPRFIRVHDFCHHNARVIDDVYDIIRPQGDLPPPDARHALLAERLSEALGDVPKIQKTAYQMLLGLASHDITVLRGLFGDPDGIAHTELFDDGLGILSILKYDGVPCTFEIGRSDRLWMDESVSVYFPQATLTIEFPSPYMKNAETKVVVKESLDDGQTIFSERIASRDEAFRRELLAFHHAVVTGEPPETDGAAALRDVELLRDIALKWRG